MAVLVFVLTLVLIVGVLSILFTQRTRLGKIWAKAGRFEIGADLYQQRIDEAVAATRAQFPAFPLTEPEPAPSTDPALLVQMDDAVWQAAAYTLAAESDVFSIPADEGIKQWLSYGPMPALVGRLEMGYGFPDQWVQVAHDLHTLADRVRRRLRVHPEECRVAFEGGARLKLAIDALIPWIQVHGGIFPGNEWDHPEDDPYGK